MNDSYLMNIPSMSAGKMVKQLSAAYSSLINRKIPVKKMPSLMLWGPPGVGKSQAVTQIADAIEEQTGKLVTVLDVRLLLLTPIDLHGLPIADKDKDEARWLMPEIFKMDPSEDRINILLLEELSAAPPSVQAAAYQIALDRRIGEFRLADNCIVVACGNRITDRAVAYKMPKPLSNRMLHIEITPDFESWHKWAASHGINGKVLGFLTFRPDQLMKFDATSDELAFATPRSWEMVSDVLNCINDNVAEMFQMIAGIIGTGIAVELRNWEAVYKDLPKIEDIFQGRMPQMPKGTDALYALTAAMFEYARAHKNDMDLIANSIEYADKMPPDFFVILMKDYMYMEKDYKIKLMKLPAFVRWLNQKGHLLNGII